MMKRYFVTAFLAAMMMIAPSKMSAQEDNGFKKFIVEEAFEDNGFQWFRDAQLLAAGNKEKSNAMTIGWGDPLLHRSQYGDRVQDHVCCTIRSARLQERCTQADVCKLPCWHTLYVYR